MSLMKSPCTELPASGARSYELCLDAASKTVVALLVFCCSCAEKPSIRDAVGSASDVLLDLAVDTQRDDGRASKDAVLADGEGDAKASDARLSGHAGNT